MTLSPSPKIPQLRTCFAIFLVNIAKLILWVLWSGFLGFISHGTSPHQPFLSTWINQALLPTLSKASFMRHAMKTHSQPRTGLVFLWTQLHLQPMLTIPPLKSDKLRLTKVLLAALDGLPRPLNLISQPYTLSCLPIALSLQLATWSLHSMHFIIFTPHTITKVSFSLQTTLHLCTCTFTILLPLMP